MINGVISSLSAFLIGGSPAFVLQPDREALMKFHLLLAAPPNPIHSNVATNKQKRDAEMAISMLQFAPEGIHLIKELNTLQNTGNQINFNIKLHFGRMLINPGTNEPRDALGFTDAEDPNNPGEVRKDLQIFILYDNDAPPTEFSYPLEEDYDIARKIVLGSSRMALTVFHELLHVFFIMLNGDLDNTGHSVANESGQIIYERSFINRIKKFRSEIERIEKSIRK